MIKVHSPLIFSCFYQNLMLNFIRNLTWNIKWCVKHFSWQCSTPICKYNNARPHITSIAMLSHMLPEWQCSATCCQNDTAEAHWLWIRYFPTSTIFSWSLTQHHLDTFIRQKNLFQKRSRKWNKDFLASK